MSQSDAPKTIIVRETLQEMVARRMAEASPGVLAVCRAWHGDTFGKKGWGGQEFVLSALGQADKAIRAYAATLPQSETQPADAWLILRSDGSKDVVLSPLTDDTYMDEGDEAWPLYRAAPSLDGNEEKSNDR